MMFFINKAFIQKNLSYLKNLGYKTEKNNFFNPFAASIKIHYKDRDILFFNDSSNKDTDSKENPYYSELRIKIKNRKNYSGFKKVTFPSGEGCYHLLGNYLVSNKPDKDMPDSTEKAKQLLEDLYQHMKIIERNEKV